MKQVHMVLQGKGGVGKSLVASLLAQHFMARDIKPICIDTDPVNATFAAYKEYGATRIELMRGNDLDPRAFDELVEHIMSAPENSIFVIDNGASTFVPLCSWMAENNVVQFFAAAEINLTIHSVLTGGQALGDTMVGLGNLLKGFDVPVVVWLNEYFGKVERDGAAFEDSKLFKQYASQILALVRIAAVRKETFGYDLDMILRDKKTFAAAQDDPSLSIMARQRLVMIWRELNNQMSAANL